MPQLGSTRLGTFTARARSSWKLPARTHLYYLPTQKSDVIYEYSLFGLKSSCFWYFHPISPLGYLYLPLLKLEGQNQKKSYPPDQVTSLTYIQCGPSMTVRMIDILFAINRYPSAKKRYLSGHKDIYLPKRISISQNVIDDPHCMALLWPLWPLNLNRWLFPIN